MVREPRKPWSKPEMIVLLRSDSAETVLVTCKGTGIEGDPNNTFDNCMNGTSPICSGCDVVASS